MEVLTRETFLHTDFTGYGYGYGYGSGYGDGSGLKTLNGKPVDMIDNVPTIRRRSRKQKRRWISRYR